MKSPGKASGSHSNSASSLLLMTLSVLLMHLAIQDGSPRPWVDWTELTFSILVAFCFWRFFRRPRGERTASLSTATGTDSQDEGTLVVHSSRNQDQFLGRHSAGEVLFLFAFCLLPFVADVFLRRNADHGNPLEIQFTQSIRNLMFGMLVLGRSTSTRLSVFISLFLAIYGTLVTVSTATYVLLAIYSITGLWWLMGDYWCRISARFPDESSFEIPYFARTGAIVLVLVSLLGGAVATQSSTVTSAFSGFLASSGGTGGSDPFARGGVGDGDQMVGAKDDASSFGPIESELFLESKQPTLYDMFIDTYETPTPKKRNSRSRAIPLSASENQKKNHSKKAQNKKASREFSVIRRESGERERKKLEDTESTALLFVAGRTPLHLGLAVYDQWDGQSLSLQGEFPGPELRLETDASSRSWARWDVPLAASGAERHQLKIINLSSPTVPSPPDLTGVHIDKLHDARFFAWEDGTLRFKGKKIPALSVLHVESRPPDREQLESVELRRTDSESSLVSTKLQDLATQWTEGVDSEWGQIQRIVKQLKGFEHDRRTLVPEDVEDAVEYFLFESKTGPDYLFATSAAVLVRSLGYRARVVSGLYANPKNYDRMARATGVFASDVHFWTEVQDDAGRWIPVDATPGYESLYARRSLAQMIKAEMSGIVSLLKARPVTSLMLGGAALSSILFRSYFYTAFVVFYWRAGLYASPRQQVLRSVVVLQRLCARHRMKRQVGQTIDSWIASLGESHSDATTVLEFRKLVSWACYAPSLQPVLPADAIRQVCISSVQQLKQRL